MIAAPDAGTYTFTSIASFIADQPFRQTLTVNPNTGERTNFPRYFVQHETAFFFQDDWKVNAQLNLNLGMRHDYFGDVSERKGRLSSLVFGQGSTFQARLASASLTRVDRLYTPQKNNFSPRIGLAYDPFGDGKSAIRYAESLTRDVHGVSDAEFQTTRANFNDAQIVELTMTTAFFNYFIRYCEGANLPVEKWAIDEPVAQVTAAKFAAPPARVSLVSDAQMNAVADALAAAKEQAASPNGLGLGMANSQRAFLLVPAVTKAWRGYTNSTREYNSVNREIKLHVSFAVSMANGCRYCTLHQVLGLRRLNVDPAKLMAMAKDDAALTPRELTAVTFARKLTREPAKVTKADYAALITEFKEQGALELLLQTCNFAYMNRFTDGLRLPSEDEAIEVYRETYGKSFEDIRKPKS